MDTVTQTIDVFHRGGFVLVQPARGAHRAGMDALVLAAALPAGFSGAVADFGAGAGGVGLAVANRCADARVTLVELSLEMADFARRTLDHPVNASAGGRLSVLIADAGAPASARAAAGLADRSFDAVVMNPPFNATEDRASPNAARRLAHVAEDGLLDRWLRSAAAVLRPRGLLALIARPSSLAEILSALERRFGAIEIVPVHPTAERPAIRIVVRARLGSRAATSLAPPLVLHDRAGGPLTPRAEAISAGTASLFGD